MLTLLKSSQSGALVGLASLGVELGTSLTPPPPGKPDAEGAGNGDVAGSQATSSSSSSIEVTRWIEGPEELSIQSSSSSSIEARSSTSSPESSSIEVTRGVEGLESREDLNSKKEEPPLEGEGVQSEDDDRRPVDSGVSVHFLS